MTITAVGSLATADASSLNVSPTALGDVLVLAVVQDDGTTAATGISGGGVTTWHQLAVSIFAGSGVFYVVELWFGVVTSTGAGTITPTLTTAGDIGLACQQFSVGAPAVWAADGAGAGGSGTASSGNFPSVTPAGAGELFVGTMVGEGGALAGSTSGYTYDDFFFSNFGLFAFNPSVSAPSAPNWSQGSSLPWNAVSGLLTATVPPASNPGLLPMLL